MTIMLWVLGVGIGLELLLFLPIEWHPRQALAALAMVATAFASGGVLMLRLNLYSVLLFIAGSYRVFNDIRLIQGRMHEGYLWRTTRRTAGVLIALQVLLGAVWWLGAHSHAGARVAWSSIAVVQVLVALVFFASTLRRLRRTAWPNKLPRLRDEDLPAVTVAIPARNETDDLQVCLESVIASNYPKLEILVLDDCSQTKRTPEIIRSFAHDGVRFIEGGEPSDTWLPKNHAYYRLAEEASGTYILFCGVDVRLAPDSIRQLVTTLHAKNKQMLSVLPQRAVTVRSQFALAQAMRYWWELAPPRRFFRRPPVLSSCWIIQAEALKRAGGFVAVARAIVPEAHFAKVLATTDAYSFLRAGELAGIVSSKSNDEQRQTAIRLRYPQLHRRPENVLAVTLLELLCLVLPFVLAVIGWWLPGGVLVGVFAAVSALLLAATYGFIACTTGITSWWFAIPAVPLMALYDVGILHYSMWRYEFSTVDWKGRNICVPAMHVIPHLPKI